MKNKNHFKTVCFTVAAAMFVFACALAVMYALTMYMPFLLVAAILWLPALTNLSLAFTFSKPKESEKPQKPEKEGVKFFKRTINSFVYLLKKIGYAINQLVCKVMKKRTNVVLVLAFLSVAVSNILFWFNIGKTSAHVMTPLSPIIAAVLFVALIVLEKLAKHTLENQDENFYKTILSNLVTAASYSKITLLVTTVVVAVCALGYYDASMWLNIALAVLFLYVTAFTVLGLAVRGIRNEIDTYPEVFVPFFNKKTASLSVIDYLEQNTGITMRSLWSMQLIKRIIPYSVMGVALALWLSTGIVQVETYQQGALYRLGKLKDTLTPGVHITLPVPFDKVEMYDTETINEITVGYLSQEATDNLWTEAHGNNEYKLLLGGGNELVSINLRIEYKIDDLNSYLRCSSAPASLLESAAYETVTAVTINSDLDTMLAADRTAFSDSFAANLRERISKYNTGLDIVSVVIESIHPPVEIADSYQGIISAGIQAEQLLLEAEGKAGVKVAEAEAERDKNINQAMSEGHKNIADAQSSVAEFTASLAADNAYGDGYRYYKYLEALKKTYSNAKLVIVGKGIDSESIYFGNIG